MQLKDILNFKEKTLSNVLGFGNKNLEETLNFQSTPEMPEEKKTTMDFFPGEFLNTAKRWKNNVADFMRPQEEDIVSKKGPFEITKYGEQIVRDEQGNIKQGIDMLGGIGSLQRVGGKAGKKLLKNVITEIKDLKLGDDFAEAVKDVKNGIKAYTDLPVLLGKDGKDIYVKDGNHRIAEALEMGESKINATFDEDVYKQLTKETLPTIESDIAKAKASGKSFDDFLENNSVYHSTDSVAFNEFDITKAKKGDSEIFNNPLGDGLYVSSDEQFTKRFGKNTFNFVLPSDAKKKIITANTFETKEFPVIYKQTLKEFGINYESLSLSDKVAINRLIPNTPIEALYDLEVIIKDILEKKNIKYKPNLVADTIKKITTKRNDKYDAVVYRNTNDVFGDADEIIINPSYVDKLKTKSQLKQLWDKQ